MTSERWYFLWARWLLDFGRWNGWNVYVRVWPRPAVGLLFRPKGWQVSIWPFRHAYVARTDGRDLQKVWARSKLNVKARS